VARFVVNHALGPRKAGHNRARAADLMAGSLRARRRGLDVVANLWRDASGRHGGQYEAR
jgi:hypothetical protein